MALFLNGRVTEYTNQVIYEEDFLRSNLYNMVGVAKLAETILGTGINNSTLVCGLPCAPISPPGMEVVVGVGAMYSSEVLDATPYSVLPADTNPNHKLYKQGVNFDPVTLATPAPTTPGNSVIHLVQAVFQEIDENNVSRPYFNPASTPTNPLPPIFENNYDTRAALINITLKQGVQSSSPVPPTPDAGYTGLYYVAVTYGQTTIISGDITKVSTIEGQPFITEGLLNKISSGTIAADYVSIVNQQKNIYIYANDVGSLNTIVANPANVYPAYVAGMIIDVLIATTNTGAATININSQGAIAIQIGSSTGLIALSGNELVSGVIAKLQYNGSTFQLLNPSNNSSSLVKYAQVSFQPTTTQTISGDTVSSPVKVTFDNTLNDTLGWWNSGSHRFIPTIAGKYRINAIIHEHNGVYGCYIMVYKNGSLNRRVAENSQNSGDGSNIFSTIGSSYIIQMNGSTDYLELFAAGLATFTLGYDLGFGGGDTANLFEIQYLGT